MLENIVIVSDSGSINGGNANVALTSAVELSKRGKAKLYLFCGTQPIEKSVEKSDIQVICINQKDILRDSNRIRAIVNGVYNKTAKEEFEKLISGLNPKTTVVHFHSWSKVLSASLFSVTAKYRIPIVITMHDYFTFCPNGGLFIYPKKKICDNKAMSLQCVFCNCDSRKYVYKIWRVCRQIIQNRLIKKNKDIKFITISDLNNRLAEENLSELGTTVRINNPVNMNEAAPVISENNKKYVYIGRLSEEKGIDMFCQAITELGYEGLVIGDGYMLSELKEKYPKIQFTGWINKDSMREYLENVRALVFPSIWYEGAPLTITEMLSYGIPCIVSDACSGREMICDGKNGYLFKSGNIEDLKCKIALLNENVNLKSGDIVNSFDRNKYTQHNHVNSLIGLYESMVR